MSEHIRDLVRESDAFTRCPDCGTVVVCGATHRCRDPDRPQPTTREERERLAADDTRTDETRVGVFRRSSGSAYAYHDLDESGDPVCSCSSRTKATAFEIISLEEAKRRGKSPCGSCRQILERGREG